MTETRGQWLYLQSKGLAFLFLLIYTGQGFARFTIEAYEAGWFSNFGERFHYARMVAAFIWTILTANT